MKTKKNKIALLGAGVVAAAAVFTAGLMILRPDYRYTAAATLGNAFSTSPLYEVKAEDLSLSEIDLTDYEISENLMLVNKSHTLQADYKPVLADYKDTGTYINIIAKDDYAAMSQAIFNNTGERLWVMSSYRTADEQVEIEAELGSATAMPAGSSEHQTGLALDLYFTGFAGSAIIKCDAGRYLADNCSQYGFILRYPPLKENFTGIEYEPWHYRYVGMPHSKIITDGGFTLEEYINSLEYGKYYRYDNYIITRTNDTKAKVPESSVVSVSEDNCGGYIITAKMLY